MALNSGIEWTDATWNPVTGCDKVSPGCTFCYAKARPVDESWVHRYQRSMPACDRLARRRQWFLA